MLPQMFPLLPTRADIVAEAKLASQEAKNVSWSVQKQFLLSVLKFCFGNVVSLFPHQ